MKTKKFLLVAVENGMAEEVAESDSWERLMNRAIKEMKKIARCFDGSVTWFVLEVATDRIWFHVGAGRPEAL